MDLAAGFWWGEKHSSAGIDLRRAGGAHVHGGDEAFLSRSEGKVEGRNESFAPNAQPAGSALLGWAADIST
jgi:hypothetical protein